MSSIIRNNSLNGVVVSPTAPSAGEVLTATSSSAADWSPSSGSITFVDLETPTPAVGGGNTVFHLAHTPSTGSLYLYLNGILQNPGGNDYTLSGNQITFNTAPLASDILLASYRM